MTRKNFKLIQAIWEVGLTQCELVHLAGLTSESRLSRIINKFTDPTELEIKRICEVLGKGPAALGLADRGLHAEATNVE